MRKQMLVLGAVGLALMGCHAEGGDHEEGEQAQEGQKVTREQLPEAVKATLDKEAKGGKVEDIEKQTLDGKVIYEADVILGGKEWEIRIAADGTLVGKKLEGDAK